MTQQPMQLIIPTLETARLSLIPPHEGQLDDLLSVYGDADVMHHLGGPRDRATLWQMLASQMGHWALRGYGVWAVRDNGSGHIIGRCGLMYPEGNPMLEVGWVLGRSSWGKGYATEAARAALGYAFDVLAAPCVMAKIAPANGGSLAVAHKLGMRHNLAVSTEKHHIFHLPRHSHSAAEDTQPQADASARLMPS